jgi:hypothetical protein
VLLTAITTILGLIPMAIGFNIDFIGLFASYEPNIFLGGDNNVLCTNGLDHNLWSDFCHFLDADNFTFGLSSDV